MQLGWPATSLENWVLRNGMGFDSSAFRQTMESWMSGLNRQPAKLLCVEICTVGSNPTLSTRYTSVAWQSESPYKTFSARLAFLRRFDSFPRYHCVGVTRMAREVIANHFYAGSTPVTYSKFARFVYRLGRCPFKAERPVRFWYRVPFVLLT